MIDYKTDTRQAQAAGDNKDNVSPEELLQERRAYYYDLVNQVFGDEPKGRATARKNLLGLSVHDVMAMYAAMRTSREIDMMQGLLQRTGNLWFSIAGAGKEAINVAIASTCAPTMPSCPTTATRRWRCGPASADRHHAPERGFALRPACRAAARCPATSARSSSTSPPAPP